MVLNVTFNNISVISWQFYNLYIAFLCPMWAPGYK